MLGRTVSHYRIVDRLGEGGMGVVYRAEDTKLGREVAIKFLHSGPMITDEIRERFVTEARAAAALNHPNIATIHGIGEDGDDTFIVMELVEGESLKSLVDTEALDPDQILDLALEIAEGLAAAHDKGIVHRDIKSANIMVLPDGRAKILDFGLAKMEGGTMVTTMGMSMGTVAYMSPEQARGEHVDHRTDIWAYGVVLYEMLTGRMPFPGAYEQSVMYAIFNEEPKPLGGTAETAALYAPILRRLLAKDSEDRYASMHDVIADLKSAQRGAVISSTDAAAVTLDSASETTIAVLPFSDMSREKDQEYFCDGITEELIDALSQVDQWRVVSRTSTFAFKGKDVELAELGSKLKASHVLEGSLRKAASRVRITTRLTGVSDGLQLWSEKYDGELDDIFEIQDEIAHAVLEKLKVSFADGGVPEKLAKRTTENMEAYQLYLQARFHMNKRTVPDLLKAIEFCEEAIAQDGTFAQPHAGIADALVLLAVQGAEMPKEAMPRAKTEAKAALAADESLAEAHTSLGTVLASYDWNRPDAEQAFFRAMELNPNYATAHHWYGLWCLLPEGRFDEAIDQLRVASELDPMSLALKAGLGWVHYLARSYDKAEADLRDMLAEHPDFVMAHDILGQTLLQMGRTDEAIEELERSTQLSDRRTLSLSLLAYMYSIDQQGGQAFMLRNELEGRQAMGYVSTYDMALVQC
ncbi:MAG: protein kinase, partial [Rhodothermia bacterium]|nr:protein kinase [Rhodothermia bacterium]